MNRIPAEITAINTAGNLSEVQLTSGEIKFTVLLVETPETAPYLKIGSRMTLLFKETEVILAENSAVNVSIQNRFHGTISEIKKSEILSEIILKTAVGTVKCLISTSQLATLPFYEGQEVAIFVKANEIMLSE
ncbi:TOBE domain-containing protein [Aequorivita echinoideorum]|uniref:TOBE domain-containing protein n=1 Tax=Aequorivita echinoideorum TaxID=1549647 RepID=A0ABS5S4G4_9FLAO|nr:TOBE domain-containing protein [Aequorivita echinoideorum]MBT0608119.1 TOBE domain-containing protein [Aequorivita echinoideorum]